MHTCGKKRATDGDDLNIHAPQTVDAAAEVRELMHAINYIISPETSRPMMAMVYDGIVGSYLLTLDESIVDPDDLVALHTGITSVDQLDSLPSRLMRHNVNPLSGKALFSAALPADFTYNKGDVEIRNGILIKGDITKDHIGTTHGSIVHSLQREYGKERAGAFLTDLPHLIDNWFILRGFSVGLGDCVAEEGGLDKILREEIAKAKLKIRALGVPPKETLEREQYEKRVSAIVRSVKDIGARLINEALPASNAFRIMAKSKAKGNEVNVAQIMAMLGQQFYRGKRIEPGISQGRRCLPYFDLDELNPEAYGFVVHGFLQGLNPAELFFHLTASREGLTDTAVKTSETGAMHGKIVGALKSITVAYDGSVRGPTQTIFQFVYGEDGFDAAEMQRVKTATGEVNHFINLKEVTNRINSRYGY